MALCDAAPPHWVQLSTYIHEGLEGGVFQDWWDNEFRDQWSIDSDAGGTGHVFAQHQGGSTDRLTPKSVEIGGDFILDVRFQYGSYFVTTFGLEVRKVSDDSLVCKVLINSSAIEWYYPGGPEFESLGGHNWFDRFWVRIRRTGTNISCSWFDDFGIAGGSYSFSWQDFTNIVSGSNDDVYLVLDAAEYGGFAEMQLQADEGFPCNISPNAEVNAEIMDKCYHLGLKAEQGGGWDEVRDGDWAWPTNQASIMTVIDEQGHRRLTVLDRRDQIRYIINTKDGPTGSGLVWRNRDKVDPNVAGSGTDIQGGILRRYDFGEKRNYTMDHIETSVQIEPRKVANRGASGYTDDGLLDGQQFDAYLYRNGEDSYAARAIDIPIDREIVFDRKTPGRPLQFELLMAMSDWRITGFEHHYSVYDIPQYPKKNSNDVSMQATVNQNALRTPLFWVSRNHSNPLMNRARARPVTGTAGSTTTGPDGQSGSAVQVSP